MAAPSATAAMAPMATDRRTAVVPLVKNHGSSGRIAPTEKEKNDDYGGLPRGAGVFRIDAQLKPGVGIQGNAGIGHEDAGHGVRFFG